MAGGNQMVRTLSTIGQIKLALVLTKTGSCMAAYQNYEKVRRANYSEMEKSPQFSSKNVQKFQQANHLK